jgi:hypothetical protein
VSSEDNGGTEPIGDVSKFVSSSICSAVWGFFKDRSEPVRSSDWVDRLEDGVLRIVPVENGFQVSTEQAGLKVWRLG